MKVSVIMIFAMFGIFLTFAVYGMVTFDVSVQEMKKLLGTRNESFSFNMMQDLDKYINDRLEDFRKLSKSEIIQQSLKESNEEFSKIADLESFVEQKESQVEFDSAPFIKDISDTKLTDELIEIIRFYRDEYGYDVVEEFFITNSFGANVALGSGTSDYRQDDEEWWQITKNTGLFIGDLKYREEYESHAIGFGFRVDDENGNFLGVMRVVLTLDDLLHDFVNDAAIVNLPNRNIVLLDSHGRVLYSKDIQDFTNSEPVSYFPSIVEGKDVGTIELADEQDEVKIVSYAKSSGYKTFPGFDWVVLVDQSSSSFVEEFVELRDSIITISIVGMIASVAIGIIVSFFITNPLKHLSQIAESISAGKFDVKAKKTKIDEIEVIVDSFNKMSESLKKLIETEKKLAETQVRVKNERLVAIGELAASMAHDLKNPLGTVRSSADIIKRTKGSSKEMDKVIERMDRAVGRMVHQVEDVLNFVRITPLTLSQVSLLSVLNSAVQSLKVPNNITIELPQQDVQLKCDSRKIEIVFINLVLNAIQSIGNKEGKIAIRANVKQDFVIIYVEDSGSGISEDLVSKIFDPLVTTKEKGTGLGLSTCKNIIEQHGGTISAKNNPTTFSIELPIKP